MPNGRASQVQFRYQRPIDGIYRVGPVGSNMDFTSIQDAIDEAVADGYTSNSNPATIEIYPGVYTEDLTLSPGVHLRGVQSGLRNSTEVIVNGTLTYALSAGGLGTNILNIDCIAIQPVVAGAKAVVFSGTSAGRLNFRQCLISSATAVGGTTGLVTVSNTGGGSTCRFTDCIISGSLTTDTELVQCSAAQTEFYGGQGGLNNASGGTIATAVGLSGTATMNVRMQTFVGGAFTQIFTIGAASNVLQIERTVVQNTLAGGHLFNFAAAGTVRASHSGLFTANLAGKIGNGASGSLLIQSCRFAGTQTAPNAQIDTGITSLGTGAYNVESDQIYKEFQVGRGVGFQTIQAAITAAAASSVGNRKVVKIPPGTYNENLTLAPDVDLVADSFDANAESAAAVNINGVHSLAFTAGETVNIKGIVFSSVAVSATALFTVSGAGSGSLRFERCHLTKLFAGTTAIIGMTNSGGANVSLDNCVAAFTADGGAMFDLSASSGTCGVFIQGNSSPASTFSNRWTIGPTTPGTPTVLPLFASSASGSNLRVSLLTLFAETTEIISSNSGLDSVYLVGCFVSQTVIEGEFARLYNGGFNFFISECTIDQAVGANPNGLPCLVRDDGTQASATITIDSNPSDGDFITINGIVFTARVAPSQANEFAIGGTTSDTADNIRNVINSSLSVAGDGFVGVLALVYATTAANVVTVKSFGDSVGNAYTLASSVPLVLIPSGATLSGGVDGSGGTVQLGVNSVQGQASGSPSASGGLVVASPVDGHQFYNSTINQPVRDALIVQEDGVQLQSVGQNITSQILNFSGAGVAVSTDIPNPRKANIVIPGQANLGEFIVGTNPTDYATIQDALDAADAVGPTVYRRVVLVSPGSYVEDLTLYDNVDIAARTFADHALNVAPVNIVGAHSWDSAGSGSTIVFTGLHFSVTTGSIEIVANGNNQNSMQFHNCNLIKQLDEVDPMFLISNVNNAQMYFQHCTVTHVTDSGATFDIAAGASLFWYGTNIGGNNFDMNLTPATPGDSLANLMLLGAGAQAFVKFGRMVASCETMFSLGASAVVTIEQSDIIQNVDTGEMFRFTAAGVTLTTYHNRIEQSDSAGNAPLLIRDGDQASGTVTVDTVPTAGDTLTVNGVVFTAVNGAPAADQFQVDGGATVNDVADNIRDAINNSVSAGIDEVVYGRSSTNVVTITARESGVAGNAITLATSVPAVLLLSGATLAGGTAGVGGTWAVTLNVFPQVSDYMSSVTAVLPPVTPTAV